MQVIRLATQAFAAVLAVLLILSSVWNFNLLYVAAALLGALVAGRFFCGWLCPLGLWTDRVIPLISRRREMPRLLRAPAVRAGFAAAFIGGLAWLVAGPIPGPVRMVSLLGAMFIVATAAGVAYRPRSWCAHLCPWGTIAGMIAARSRYRLTSAGECSGCRRCVRACPTGNLETAPEMGRLPVQACIMCLRCAGNCPNKCLDVAAAD